MSNIKLNIINIWQPRWHDRVVMIAKYKVKKHNVIKFTKVPNMKDEYYISGDIIKKYPLESNGIIPCYIVPLEELLK